MTKAGLTLQTSPAFQRYLDYRLVAERMEPAPLWEEVAALESTCVEALAKTPQAQALLHLSRYLALAERLIALTLTPHEWHTYQQVTAELQRVRSWQMVGITNLLPQDRLAPFEDFYRYADQRTHALVSNLLAKMEALGSDPNSIVVPAKAGTQRLDPRLRPSGMTISPRIAVLVTGGFHTPAIQALLHERQIPSVTLAPKLTRVEGDPRSRYLEAFFPEQTPLSRLFLGEKLSMNPPPALAASTARFGYPGRTELASENYGSLAGIEAQLLSLTPAERTQTHAALAGLPVIEEIVTETVTSGTPPGATTRSSHRQDAHPATTQRSAPTVTELTQRLLVKSLNPSDPAKALRHLITFRVRVHPNGPQGSTPLPREIAALSRTASAVSTTEVGDHLITRAAIPSTRWHRGRLWLSQSLWKPLQAHLDSFKTRFTAYQRPVLATFQLLALPMGHVFWFWRWVEGRLGRTLSPWAKAALEEIGFTGSLQMVAWALLFGPLRGIATALGLPPGMTVVSALLGKAVAFMLAHTEAQYVPGVTRRLGWRTRQDWKDRLALVGLGLVTAGVALGGAMLGWYWLGGRTVGFIVGGTASLAVVTHLHFLYGLHGLWKLYRQWLLELEPNLQWRVAPTLGRSGLSGAVTQLCTILQQDPDHEIRRMAAEALGKLGDPQAMVQLNVEARQIVLEALIQVLRIDTDVRVRKATAKALGQFNDLRVPAPLVQRLYGDSHTGVQQAVAESLDRLCAFWGIDQLTQTLHQDPIWEVREGAACALGWKENPDAVMSLAQTLQQDPAPAVRLASAVAFGHIGDPRAVDPLLQAFQEDSEPIVRGATAWVLGWLAKMGSCRNRRPQVEAVLSTRLTTEPDEEVRGAIQRALQTLKEGDTGTSEDSPSGSVSVVHPFDFLNEWALAFLGIPGWAVLAWTGLAVVLFLFGRHVFKKRGQITKWLTLTLFPTRERRSPSGASSHSFLGTVGKLLGIPTAVFFIVLQMTSPVQAAKGKAVIFQSTGEVAAVTVQVEPGDTVYGQRVLYRHTEIEDRIYGEEHHHVNKANPQFEGRPGNRIERGRRARIMLRIGEVMKIPGPLNPKMVLKKFGKDFSPEVRAQLEELARTFQPTAQPKPSPLTQGAKAKAQQPKKVTAPERQKQVPVESRELQKHQAAIVVLREEQATLEQKVQGLRAEIKKAEETLR
ncbi:MAG: HEAT repeat domain-containing protein, partial [Elusimicrobia bacterium]|nr:HEAT repeat domain-containing protein [Elusimicrobiota bacterium]